MDKERRVLAGFDKLSGDLFHYELYHLLLLTQTLPCVLRREEQAYSSAILKVL